jgi:nitrous oxidase accessory protein NosD
MKIKNLLFKKSGYVLILVFFVVPVLAQAKTLVVSEADLSGNECVKEGGGDYEACFKTIDEALAEAGSGDEVLVKAGEYEENVVIEKAVDLVCEEGAVLKKSSGIGVSIQADEVSVVGCEITGFEKGIATKDTHEYNDIVIEENEIHDLNNWDQNDGEGLYNYSAYAIEVGHESEELAKTAEYLSAGTEQYDFSGLRIAKNEIYNVYGGIKLSLIQADDFVKIIENEIHDCFTNAILVDSSQKIDIIGNSFETNGMAGIFVSASADYTGVDFAADSIWTPQTDSSFSPKYIYIENNIFTENGSWIEFSDPNRNEIASAAVSINASVSAPSSEMIYLNSNEIYDNLSAIAFYNATTAQIDALDNYWGDITGPKDDDTGDGSNPLSNPGGLGDEVIGNLEYNTIDLPIIPGQVGFDTEDPGVAYDGTNTGTGFYQTCNSLFQELDSYEIIWGEADGLNMVYDWQIYDQTGALVYEENDSPYNFTGQFKTGTLADFSSEDASYYLRVRAKDDINSIYSISDNIWNIPLDLAKLERMIGKGNNGTVCWFGLDATSPEIEFTTVETNPTKNEIFEINLDFGEEVVNFDADDITIENAEIQNLETEDNMIYRVTVKSLINDGSIKLTVAEESAEDLAGNLSLAGEYSILFDNVPPVILFEDNVNVAASANDEIKISITEMNPNVSSYMYGFSTSDNCEIYDYKNFGSSFKSGVAFTLMDNSLNGKYICVKAEDLSGNIGYMRSDGPINIDPSLAEETEVEVAKEETFFDYSIYLPIIELNYGDEETDDRDVNLEIYSPEGFGAKYMMISNKSTFEEANWEIYTNSRLWRLTDDEDDYGKKAVYVKLMDEEGHISGIALNHIIYDEDDDDEDDDYDTIYYDDYYYNSDSEEGTETGSSTSGPVLNIASSSGSVDEYLRDLNLEEEEDEEDDENASEEEEESEEFWGEENEEAKTTLNQQEKENQKEESEFKEEEEINSNKNLISSIFWPKSTAGKVFSMLIVAGTLGGLILFFTSRKKEEEIEEINELV